ncbi:MAG: hypothetical protein NT126_10660 [Bacteroidetes bacterium]|nr:hypothetical protein [Bacteroidota bacterium]
MKKIENLHELRAEISRMKGVAKQQELQIKKDLSEIRDDLRPENILWNSLSSLTGIKINRNEFLKDGIAYGISLFIQRFILKTEKKMENKVYDFMDSLFERVKSFVNKFTGADAKRSERNEGKDDFIPGE